MNVTLDGKEYTININEAITQGLLVPVREEVKSFRVGDVFVGPNHAQVFVAKAVYRSNCILPASEDPQRVYALLGLNGHLEPYSNHVVHVLFSYSELLNYINRNKLNLRGNIDASVRNALQNILNDDFTG